MRNWEGGRPVRPPEGASPGRPGRVLEASVSVDVLKPSAKLNLVPSEPVAYEKHFRLGEVLTGAVNDVLRAMPESPLLGLAARLAGSRDVPVLAGLPRTCLGPQTRVAVLVELRGAVVRIHDFLVPSAGGPGAWAPPVLSVPEGLELDRVLDLEAEGAEGAVIAELALAGARAAGVPPLEWWAQLTKRPVAPLRLALRLATFPGCWVGVVAEDPTGAPEPDGFASAADAAAALLDAGWEACLGLLPGAALPEAELAGLEARGAVVLDDPDAPGFPRLGVAPWSLRPACWVRAPTPACAYAAAAHGQAVVVDRPEDLAGLPLPVTAEGEELGPDEEERALHAAYGGLLPHDGAMGGGPLELAEEFEPRPRSSAGPPSSPEAAAPGPAAPAPRASAFPSGGGHSEGSSTDSD